MKRLFMILIVISVVCISCNGNTVKKTVADADDHSNATDTDTSNTGNDNDFADTGNTGDDLSNTGNDTGDTEPDEANTGDTDTDTDTGNTTTDDDAVPNCTSGKTECQDNEVYKCESGTWTLWDECTKQNKICAITQGIATCIEGEIPDEDAEPVFENWSKLKMGLLYEQADTYCKDLEEAGHSDWRLPTINDLRAIVINCPVTETGGACGVTNTCFDYSCDNDVNNSCNGCESGDLPYTIFNDLTQPAYHSSTTEVRSGNTYNWNLGSSTGSIYQRSVLYFDEHYGTRCIR